MSKHGARDKLNVSASSAPKAPRIRRRLIRRYPVRNFTLGVTVCIAFGSATWAADFAAKPTFKIGNLAPPIAPISSFPRHANDQVRTGPRVCRGILGNVVPAMHQGHTALERFAE